MLEKLKENQQNLGQWLQGFDWQQTREKVNQESRARIVLLGLTGAGKSTLFNQLCGWTVSTPINPATPAGGDNGGEGLQWPAGLTEPVEDYGLFCLVDLPAETGSAYEADPYDSRRFNGHLSWPGREGLYELGLGSDYLTGLGATAALDPLSLAEGADLLLYVLDGARGVQAADYRWVGRLRRLGLPLLIALNKSDLLETNLDACRQEIEGRLGTIVLPVSALTGLNVRAQLLARMVNLCPHLTVALGRELKEFRRPAAERLIYQAALINGLVAFEPIPLVDLPIQIITLTGLMLRIAAIYDRPPADVRRREVVLAIAGGLAGRYGAQQVAKLVPVVGWLVSSIIGWSCTWSLGRAAIAYFEAGGDIAVDRGLGRAKDNMLQLCRAVYGRWQRRPRLRLKRSSTEMLTQETSAQAHPESQPASVEQPDNPSESRSATDD